MEKATFAPQVAGNIALERLAILAGEWDVAASFGVGQPVAARGRASFTWLEDGAFLLYRSSVDQAGFPRATAVIGPDDTSGAYCMVYHDSRGVSRIYEMSLSDGVWRLWRKSPGFSQRFTGAFSDDGNTIAGLWEKSSDGETWERDFDLTYQRVR